MVYISLLRALHLYHMNELYTLPKQLYLHSPLFSMKSLGGNRINNSLAVLVDCHTYFRLFKKTIHPNTDPWDITVRSKTVE